ncbi:hypothetical protein COU78_01280 [Candidatus Peregrinibacteria bacterium CG10_big_fil_rev_8_21_14_0_10_49_24]|nr:MAG: hypothetical protein COV83_04245 [Candidatus Peregrinibacteria bacterium CG11_big_fil_rev_8_21_14_0_20_49_14]PIR51358.1 MAG: hypothetical protein COU78_01280 [Candidatus Peregrinibacteria bacterium CG10_big_fil_rev_8_21_14_0_10_49_24]PJA68122.1 MAG: hypothetical protein CO157_01095 [Candidatus Peregrinibacteria bacterium CG_4_9_14_3_um_filter_49_12]
MMLLLLPVGLLLPTVSGWLTLRLVEKEHPVLLNLERWTLGCLLGTTLSMYLSFLAHIAGFMSLSLTGFLGIQVSYFLLVSLLWMRFHVSWHVKPVPSLPKNVRLSKPVTILLATLMCWTLLKLIVGAVILVSTPPYQDDVFNNWNMRGKLFGITNALTLEFAIGNDITAVGGVSSYPPTVSMTKTMLTDMARQWHEGLANSIHFVWFLCVLILVYCTLRRRMPAAWALAGVYGLSSLPLFFMHGVTPYADVFMAAHIFAAVSMLYGAVSAQSDEHSASFLRLGALATGLLVFTKNEALLLYLPVILLLLVFILRHLHAHDVFGEKQVRRTVSNFAMALLLVGAPWILFKLAHNLPFGNAKSVSGLEIAWQEGVAYAIIINTFFEGNWALLIPLLLGCIVFFQKESLRSATVIFTAFFLLLYIGQLPLFFFTGLSTEALNQTGYARGLVQIAPIGVTALFLIVHSVLSPPTAAKD